MAVCYICNENITNNNSSLEHIIPNSLGGNLKSRNLLCKECNSNLGSNLDAELAIQLNLIANMLNIERDRGKPQSFEASNKYTDEKYRFLPGGKPELIRPNIEINKNDKKTKIKVNARDEKQAREVLQGLKRKYNIKEDDLKNIMDSFKLQEKPFKEHITVDQKFGGEEALKSVAKIILNYYTYTGQDIKWISEFVDKYTNENYDILSRISFIYLPNEVISKKEDEILHSIIIRGDTKEKLLYGYVELFNCYRVLVFLSDSYNGPSLNNSYFFDVEERIEKERNYNLNLSKKEILEFLDISNDNYISNQNRLIDEMNNIFKLIAIRHRENLTDKILWDSLMEMESKFPKENNEFNTSEMFSFFASEVSKKYVQYFMDTNRQ